MRDFGRIKDSYDFSLDTRQLGLVILAVIAFAALVFVLGVSVGRQWEKKASGKETKERVEAYLDEPEPGGAIMQSAPPVAPPVDPPVAPPAAAPADKEQPEKSGAGEKDDGKLSEGELTFPKVLTSGSKNTTPLKPPAPAKKPAAASAASSGPADAKSGGYTVQVGAYKDKSAANGVVSRLDRKGFDARLVPVKSSDGSYIYKVRVGSFTVRASAEKTAAALAKAEGGKPFVMLER